jgi:radical SAM/Cys-rich protein
MGKLCNQACHHCHVEAGPNRTENMTEKTVLRLLELLEKSPHIHTVDITGGAPELNPYFKMFVSGIKKMDKHVIDRCNLTVLFEKGQEKTAIFLAENDVEVVASLPCYSKENLEAQRGKGVFGKSIDALVLLNTLGYGQEDTGLFLNLVYNPVGAHLPPAQDQLEKDFKQHLKEDFNIDFNNLYTITNMPIKRYLHMLEREDKYEDYMQLLVDNFNVNAAKNVMCKNLISIGYDGQIYDCDFNQMLELPIKNKQTIWDIGTFEESSKDIVLADHCYGCTAGSGSSCSGTTL